MRFFCHLMVVAGLLSAGVTFPAFAELDGSKSARRTQVREKNVVPASYSCYTDLTMMVRGSSLDVTAKLRPSLRLSIERDDGDHVLARVDRGAGTASQIGWVVYHPAIQGLRDVSALVENDDRDAASVAENGKVLKIDRRFAYLFNQCRQRHDVVQAASCRQSQQNSNIDGTTLALRAQGQVARSNKESREKTTLYSAPDVGCPVGHDVVLKAGVALKIYHETDDFYFVRQDGFKRDFISGWILKEQVQNVKFLQAPASAQVQNVTLVPEAKPRKQRPERPAVSGDRVSNRKRGKTQKLEQTSDPRIVADVPSEEKSPQRVEPVRLAPAPSEFDVPETESVSTIMAEEERIPVPLAVKPLPPDMEPKPRRRSRPRPVFIQRDSGRDD